MTRARAGSRAGSGLATGGVAGGIAWSALVAAVVGTVLAFAAPPGVASARAGAGATLVTLGGAVATGCLWHGARHAHERGRSAAVAAIVVAVTGGLYLLWVRFVAAAPV